jgi:hypothetical protein
MAAQRDNKGGQRGKEPDESVNQQSEINGVHIFSPCSVRLDWRDVNREKPMPQRNGQGRNAPSKSG